MGMRGTAERPAGLVLAMDAVGEEAERALLDVLRGLDLEPMTIQGTPSRRLVAHFGVGYDAATRAIGDAPDAPPAVRDAADQAIRAVGRDPAGFTEILVTRYPPGAGIGQHRDAPAFGTVVGLSLLSPCTMRFSLGAGAQRRVWEQLLPPRSAYLLDGPVRTSWEHRIDAVRWERWSLTARTVRGSRRQAQRPEGDG